MLFLIQTMFNGGLVGKTYGDKMRLLKKVVMQIGIMMRLVNLAEVIFLVVVTINLYMVSYFLLKKQAIIHFITAK